MSLRGKVALVTGSTSGIGLGIARALAADGADIMLNGFGDAVQIEALRSELAATLGVKVAYSGADISKPDQIAAMVADAAKTLGAVDILVNNAGIQFTASVEEFPDDRWDQVIAINLSGVFHGMKAVIPGMRPRGGAGSSISPRRTAWSRAGKRWLTWRPSMVSSA
jgi:3-hydroxybutyrate dehydrogenase